MTIGQRIQQRRKELNMSVDDLAELLETNRATIYRYESNDIKKFPIDLIAPIAKALQTTPEYIMGWDKKEAPEPAPRFLFLDGLTDAEIKELEAYKQFIIQKRGLTNG